jgi:hypothetical protein
LSLLHSRPHPDSVFFFRAFPTNCLSASFPFSLLHLHNNTTQTVTGKEKASGAMNAQAPSKYITLVSGDGFEFVVLRDAALVSPIIKGMLDVRSQFAEAKEARCVFQEMR